MESVIDEEVERRAARRVAGGAAICDNIFVQNEFSGSAVDRALTIHELEREAGFSARTIKHLIQRGIVSPPAGATRAARYTRTHLDELAAFGALKAAGWSTEQIRHRIGSASHAASELEPLVERRYQLAAGVALVLSSPERKDDAEIVGRCLVAVRVAESLKA